MKTDPKTKDVVGVHAGKVTREENLLVYVRSLPPDEELASLIEAALKRRRQIRVRIAGR